MLSGTVVDQRVPSPNDAEVHDLLVLWQHPESREIVPIGRFSHDAAGYSFAYAQAVNEVPDFLPLPGLSDLHRRYNSVSMPAVVLQRVMGRERPDFDDYARSMGLDPQHATPWEQIVQSGGRRAGDTLQFMPVPWVAGGRAHARFFVNGMRHIPGRTLRVAGRTVTVSADDQETALRKLAAGMPVEIVLEQGNTTDRDACLVLAGDVPVGWVPRVLAADVRELASAGQLTVTVHRVGDPGVPTHVRLVLDLAVPAPAGFAFDSSGRWEPIPG